MTCSPRGAFFNTIDNSSGVDNDGYFAPYSQAVSLNSRDGRLLGGILAHTYAPRKEVARAAVDLFGSTPDRLFVNHGIYDNEMASPAAFTADDPPMPASQEIPETSTDQTITNEVPADTPIQPEDLSPSDKSEISGEPQVASEETVDVSTSVNPPQTNKEQESFIYNALKGRAHARSLLGKVAPHSNGVFVGQSRRANVPLNRENFLATEIIGAPSTRIMSKEKFDLLKNEEDQRTTVVVAIALIAVCAVIITLGLVKLMRKCKQSSYSLLLSPLSVVQELNPVTEKLHTRIAAIVQLKIFFIFLCFIIFYFPVSVTKQATRL